MNEQILVITHYELWEHLDDSHDRDTVPVGDSSIKLNTRSNTVSNVTSGAGGAGVSILDRRRNLEKPAGCSLWYLGSTKLNRRFPSFVNPQ